MDRFISEENSRRFGDDYVKSIIQALKRAGKDASGRLINSLDYRVTETADNIKFVFEAEDYYNYVDEGRRPGSYPPIQDIARWASIRGIDKRFAFPIARSIYKFGIKPANITEKVQRGFLNGVLFDDLEEYIAKEVEEDVFNKLNDLSQL